MKSENKKAMPPVFQTTDKLGDFSTTAEFERAAHAVSLNELLTQINFIPCLEKLDLRNRLIKLGLKNPDLYFYTIEVIMPKNLNKFKITTDCEVERQIPGGGFEKLKLWFTLEQVVVPEEYKNHIGESNNWPRIAGYKAFFFNEESNPKFTVTDNRARQPEKSQI